MEFLRTILKVLVSFFQFLVGQKQAGIDSQKVKEADARAEEIRRIKDAAAARPVGGVHDDPNNRDNRAATARQKGDP